MSVNPERFQCVGGEWMSLFLIEEEPEWGEDDEENPESEFGDEEEEGF